MDQCSSSEADSRSGSQKIHRLLCNPKNHYRLLKVP